MWPGIAAHTGCTTSRGRNSSVTGALSSFLAWLWRPTATAVAMPTATAITVPINQRLRAARVIPVPTFSIRLLVADRESRATGPGRRVHATKRKRLRRTAGSGGQRRAAIPQDEAAASSEYRRDRTRHSAASSAAMLEAQNTAG